MDLVKQLIPIFLTGSLALLVVAMGMASARGELVFVLRQPALLARALLAVAIIPLVAAIVVIALAPATMPHSARAGLVLMMISPVPPLVPGKGLKFGGRDEYVFGLQAAMTLFAIATVPLLGALTAQFYNVDARFPISVVAGNVFVGVFVPLAIGLVLGRRLAPHFSKLWAPKLSNFATICTVIVFVPILIGAWPEIVALVGDGTVILIAIAASVALAGGHFLGGPGTGDRASLAFAATMRHPGIALALVGANHADKSISAAVLLVMLVGMIILVPYQVMIKRRITAEQAANPA